MARRKPAAAKNADRESMTSPKRLTPTTDGTTTSITKVIALTVVTAPRCNARVKKR